MGTRRRFSAAFKRQVVEEVLAGVSTQAQVCRRYELCPTLVRSWKEQYAQGQLADPEQAGQSLQQRLQELERLVGRLTLENALLKRAVASTLQQRSERSSAVTGPSSDRSRGGVD